MKQVTRHYVETIGQFGAKVIDETDDTKTVVVLFSFDLVVSKKDQSLTPSLTSNGCWEPWITAWVINNLQEGTSFIDVGANCGYYTLLATTLVAADDFVVAYEPNPFYADLLWQSKKLNKAVFHIREFALLDKETSVTLSIPDELHGSATIMSDFTNSQYLPTNIKVRGTTLDKDLDGLLPLNKPYMAKIDAEAAEETIWRGGMSIWNSDRKGTILLEHTPHAYSDSFLNELFQWGHVGTINFEGRLEAVSKDWINSQTDWVMLVIRKR